MAGNNIVRSLCHILTCLPEVLVNPLLEKLRILLK